ncbi:MAG: steroid Delta-isomerase [Gaiellales bacterium]
MATELKMKAALQTYIDGFQQQDAERIIALFADDATIEDPVGSDLVEGKAAIADFYRNGVKFVTHMELSAPIRGSHANAAAMAFDFEMDINGQHAKTSAIDVMEFDEQGKIVRMRAYWGPSDSTMPAWG